MKTDHNALKKAAKARTDEALRFVIDDAKAAIEANPDNPKSGHYADEIAYCAEELQRRRGSRRMVITITVDADALDGKNDYETALYALRRAEAHVMRTGCTGKARLRSERTSSGFADITFSK